VQVGEVMPFIEEILNNTQSIVCDLQPLQVMIIIILPMKNLLSFFGGVDGEVIRYTYSE